MDFTTPYPPYANLALNMNAPIPMTQLHPVVININVNPVHPVSMPPYAWDSLQSTNRARPWRSYTPEDYNNQRDGRRGSRIESLVNERGLVVASTVDQEQRDPGVMDRQQKSNTPPLDVENMTADLDLQESPCAEPAHELIPSSDNLKSSDDIVIETSHINTNDLGTRQSSPSSAALESPWTVPYTIPEGTSSAVELGSDVQGSTTANKAREPPKRARQPKSQAKQKSRTKQESQTKQKNTTHRVKKSKDCKRLGHTKPKTSVDSQKEITTSTSGRRCRMPQRYT